MLTDWTAYLVGAVAPFIAIAVAGIFGYNFGRDRALDRLARQLFAEADAVENVDSAAGIVVLLLANSLRSAAPGRNPAAQLASSLNRELKEADRRRRSAQWK